MKVYELLDTPEKWMQDGMAKDVNGSLVEPENPDAVCFCLVGALVRCYARRPSYVLCQEIFHRVMAETGGPMGVWNDDPNRTYEEVIALARKLDI